MATMMLSQRGEPLTPDGDIIKLEISPAPSSTPMPLWKKGSNALLHYKVHAYIPERKSAPDTHVHSSTCSHGHKAHSHSDIEESNRKVANLMELVDKAKTGNGAFERECDSAPVLTPTCTGGEHQGCNEHSGCHNTTEIKDETSQKEEELGKPKRQFISDSRTYALDGQKPFELRIGREFIVKAMEICVISMRPGERARFLCMNEYVDGFVKLETSLRREKQNALNQAQGLPPLPTHVCGAHASPEWMDGYADLQDLYGVPLEFEIELLAVQQPEGFLKEPWEMSLLDKMSEAPQRKDEGNALYQTGDAKGALEKYTRALVLLENIMQSSAFQDSKREINQRKERREKEEWRRKEDAKRGQVFEILPLEEETSLPLKSTDIMALEQLDTSCRLNYAACQLKLGDYTSVIVQTSEVLSRSPRHLKALFRRGQAYLLLNRNLELASEDFKSLRKVLENKKMENSPEWMELLSMEKRIALEESKDLAKEKQLFSNMFLTSV